MAKTKISEFSATPGNNTDIDGINIAEGCAPSGINDAIRELMSQLKDFQAGTAGDSFNGPVGTTTAAAGAFTTLSSTGNTTLGDAAGDTVTVNGTATFANANPTLSAGTANGVAYLNGSKVLTTGSALVFDGTNLGLGVTPSAWNTLIPLEIGFAGNSFSGFGGDSGIYATTAARYQSGWKYAVTGKASTLYAAEGGAHKWSTAPSGTAGNAISFTQAMTLDASGNLGVGTTSPSYALHVQGASKSIYLYDNSSGLNLRLYNGTSSAGISGLTYPNQIISGSANALEIFTSGSSPLVFGTNSTERARIDTSGNLLLGSTVGGSDERLWVETTTADWCIQTNSTGSGTFYHIGLRANGTQVGTITSTSTTTTYGTSSDYRLKENIQPMTGALAKVAALKPVTYRWKADGSDGEGFIAHELAEICPYAVVGEKDAVDENGNIDPQSIDTSFLVATLTAALQELNAKVEAQAAEIATLKGQA